MELTLSICSDFAHLMKGAGKQKDKKPQQRKRERKILLLHNLASDGVQGSKLIMSAEYFHGTGHWSCQFHKGYQQPASEAHLINTVWALVPTTYVFSKSYLQTAVILKEKGSPSWFLKILVYSYSRNFRERQIEKQRNCIKKGGRKRNLFKKKCDFFSKETFLERVICSLSPRCVGLEFSEKAKLLQEFVKSEGL